MVSHLDIVGYPLGGAQTNRGAASVTTAAADPHDTSPPMLLLSVSAAGQQTILQHSICLLSSLDLDLLDIWTSFVSVVSVCDLSLHCYLVEARLGVCVGVRASCYFFFTPF